MMRASSIAAALGVSLAATAAGAAPPQDLVGISDPSVVVEDTGSLQRGELLLDWTIYSADDEEEGGHGFGGVGLDFTPWVPRTAQWLRWTTLYAGVGFGYLGDDRHGPFHQQVGWKPRLEIFEAWDQGVYVGFRGLVTFSWLRDRDSLATGDFDVLLSPGAALGVRVLDGLVSVEATFDPTYSLGGDFRDPGSPDDGDPWVMRGGASILTDLCFFSAPGAEDDFCRYGAPRSEMIDLTPALDAALARAAKAGTPFADELCEPVERALSLSSTDPDCPSTDADGFLCKLAKGVAGTPYAGGVEDVRRTHMALEACYRTNRADARAIGLHNQSSETHYLPKHRLQYGAYPPEMQRALSCEVGSPASRIDEKALERACEACPAACHPAGALGATSP